MWRCVPGIWELGRRWKHRSRYIRPYCRTIGSHEWQWIFVHALRNLPVINWFLMMSVICSNRWKGNYIAFAQAPTDVGRLPGFILPWEAFSASILICGDLGRLIEISRDAWVCLTEIQNRVLASTVNLVTPHRLNWNLSENLLQKSRSTLRTDLHFRVFLWDSPHVVAFKTAWNSNVCRYAKAAR